MAVRNFYGYAVAQKQVHVLTIGGTWVMGDTPTLIINGKQLVATVGATVTTAAVAALLAAMINGSAPANADESYLPEGGGPTVGEFAEVIATVSGSVITITARVAGRPFTMTEVDNSTSGTITPTDPVANTSGSNWDDVDNWQADDTPDDLDDIVIGDGSVNILDGLDQSANTPDSLTINAGYVGYIGRPPINRVNANLPYDEYRDQYLQLGNTADFSDSSAASFSTPYILTRIGEGQGAGSRRIKLDYGSSPYDLTVWKTDTKRLEPNVPCLLIRNGSDASVLRVFRGDVGVAFYPGETAALARFETSYVDNVASDANLYIGSDTDILEAVGVCSGGNIWIGPDSMGIGASGSLSIYNGSVTIYGGAYTNITMYGGSLTYIGAGTITNLNNYGGAVDLSQGLESMTITNLKLAKGSRFIDPRRRAGITNGYVLERCGLRDVQLDLGSDFTFDI